MKTHRGNAVGFFTTARLRCCRRTTQLQGKTLVLYCVQADKFIKSTTATLEQRHGNRKNTARNAA